MDNEYINQIKQELTDLGKSLAEVGKLRLIGIISKVLGLFLFILTIVLCTLALFTFAAIAAIDIMAQYMPVWAASLILGSAYIVLIALAIACRRRWFINPFIRMLHEQIFTEEELALKTLEAEHKVDTQRVRMQCKVENATREWNFYVGFFSRAWKYVRGLIKT